MTHMPIANRSTVGPQDHDQDANISVPLNLWESGLVSYI